MPFTSTCFLAKRCFGRGISINFGDSGPIAWHWEEDVKLRIADLRHSDWFPRATLLSEQEGSDGGMMESMPSLLRFVVEILKLREVWISLAHGSCFDVLALDTSHADSKVLPINFSANLERDHFFLIPRTFPLTNHS
jgi:hypothetical protein